MIDWLSNNYQWFFSGTGIFLAIGFYRFSLRLKKYQWLFYVSVIFPIALFWFFPILKNYQLLFFIFEIVIIGLFWLIANRMKSSIATVPADIKSHHAHIEQPSPPSPLTLSPTAPSEIREFLPLLPPSTVTPQGVIETKLTPEEIITKIRDIPPLQRPYVRQQFKGQHITWDCKLFTAHEKPDGSITLNLIHKSDEYNLVYLDIDPKDYPGIRLLRKNHEITVSGSILTVEELWIIIEKPKLYFDIDTTI
jgi:hypothetical protein